MRGITRFIFCWISMICLIGCTPPKADPPSQKEAAKPPNTIKILGQSGATTGIDPKQTPWQLVVKMYVLPRDRDLTAAAAGLDDAEIGHAKKLMWAYNGFRLGQVPVDGLGLFEPLLGRTIETTEFTLRNATSYQYVSLTTRGAIVDLATTDSIAAEAMENHRFAHGRFRMLLRVDPPKDVVDLDKPTYTILPQYHRIRLSPVIRTSQQKMLDGTLFEDLKLTLPIQPGHAMVIHAKLPLLPEKVEPKPPTETAPKQNPELPGLTVTPAKPAKTVRTMRLAEAMLSGNYKKTKRLVQVVLIVRAEPAPTPKVAPQPTTRGDDR